MIGLALYEFGIASEYVNIQNVEQRIEFFVTGGDVVDYSTEEREFVADKAWHMFTDNPVLGKGTGATVTWDYEVSTHNMYLLFLAEQGLVGGALYLSFISIIVLTGVNLIRHRVSREDRDLGVALALFGCFYVLIGLFSHTILEEPQTQFLLAFLFAAVLDAAAKTQTSDAPGVVPYRG
jgi:O-antigen ligase